jgi:hypothetical protein
MPIRIKEINFKKFLKRIEQKKNIKNKNFFTYHFLMLRKLGHPVFRKL